MQGCSCLSSGRNLGWRYWKKAIDNTAQMVTVIYSKVASTNKECLTDKNCQGQKSTKRFTA